MAKEKRKDVKSSFTSSLFTYILFLVPLLSTPHYVHIHKDIVVSPPSLRGKEKSRRASWVTFYLLPYIDRTDAIHEILSKHCRTCLSRRYLCLGSVGHILRLEGTCLCSVRITCRSPVTTLASYLIKVTIIITIYTCHWEE